MDLGAHNVLGLLRGLSANPQDATATLKLFEATAAGLEQDTRAMSANTVAAQQAAKVHQEATAALRLFDQEVTAFSPKVRTLTTDLAHSQLQSQLAVVPVKQMQEAFRALGPELSTATAQTEQHANAVQRAALALRTQTSAGIELASKGLVGLIAGRKAQAGMEAVWETARGIALLAEGTWPPNPAAIVAAGLHFEAAAQYALLAGTGSRPHSAGAGGGAYERGGGYGAGESSYGPAAQTLAPGAAAASARFGSGVVIIRGTQAFEEYVAGAVNGAVARGVTVTATQSQRGAPVGH
ncbi:MAG: hypothetical protein ABSF14_23140 [Terriglobia bacterium]|jgi:hypothetical protein